MSRLVLQILQCIKWEWLILPISGQFSVYLQFKPTSAVPRQLFCTCFQIKFQYDINPSMHKLLSIMHAFPPASQSIPHSCSFHISSDKWIQKQRTGRLCLHRLIHLVCQQQLTCMFQHINTGLMTSILLSKFLQKSIKPRQPMFCNWYVSIN